ncbi:MAG: epimerase [Sphingomonadales bacterium]|nr:MAG: epimerase [Sphingomonadales bacterium]
MRIVIFGTSGMVGQGALREAVLDERVSDILSVVRSPSGQSHPKLSEIVLLDLTRIAEVADRLAGFDACLFCLGVSSLGMSEAAYTSVTHDLTLTIADVLAPRNRAMTFIYVSGTGTSRDSRQMWARVKARTEDALAAMPFKAAYGFRPGFIQPLHGVKSKTGWYAALYALTRPLAPLLTRRLPAIATTTERLGRAMIAVAANGYPAATLENTAINAAGALA